MDLELNLLLALIGEFQISICRRGEMRNFLIA